MRWKPAHGSHAIEQVATSFMLTEQVPSRAWHALLADVARTLPVKGFISSVDEFGAPPIPMPGGQVIQLSFGHPQGLTELSGRRYRVLSDQTVLEEVIFTRTHIAYVTHRYTRWKDYVSRIEDVIVPQITKVLDLVNLSIVKLEYWDRFVCQTEFDQKSYKELFSIDSGLIPKHLLDMSGLWHSHIGYFANDDADLKRLINMNVDIVNVAETQGAPHLSPQPLRRSAGIYSMAQDTWPTPSERVDATVAISHLNQQHTILVNMIGGILTEAASERISLRRK